MGPQPPTGHAPLTSEGPDTTSRTCYLHLLNKHPERKPAAQLGLCETSVTSALSYFQSPVPMLPRASKPRIPPHKYSRPEGAGRGEACLPARGRWPPRVQALLLLGVWLLRTLSLARWGLSRGGYRAAGGSPQALSWAGATVGVQGEPRLGLSPDGGDELTSGRGAEAAGGGAGPTLGRAALCP